jgi:hypothetical protein
VLGQWGFHALNPRAVARHFHEPPLLITPKEGIARPTVAAVEESYRRMMSEMPPDYVRTQFSPLSVHRPGDDLAMVSGGGAWKNPAAVRVQASGQSYASNLTTMRLFLASLIVVSALSLQLSAQERDRSLERISLALQEPSPFPTGADPQEALQSATLQALGVPIFEPLPGAAKLGPFTLGTPQLRGEVIRLSLPVGAYVARAARGVAAANRRRQEAAARRRVGAELKAFTERQRPQQ